MKIHNKINQIKRNIWYNLFNKYQYEARVFMTNIIIIAH